MSNKKLTERLNDELDELGVPPMMGERIQVCAKLFDLPKFKIEALLHGIVACDAYSMQKIAEVLDVRIEWLMGRDEEKMAH
jgi:hypothetical protein